MNTNHGSQGKYTGTTGSSACQYCLKGKYAPGQGTASCAACPTPTSSPEGASECEICISFYYRQGQQCQYPSQAWAVHTSFHHDLMRYLSPLRDPTYTGLPLDDPTSACVSCPDDADCDGGTLPRPLKNYWTDRTSLEYAGVIVPCIRETCTHATSYPASCWTSFEFENTSSCPEDMYCSYGSTGPIW